MRKILTCRRSVIALVAISACVAISAMTGADTSGAIAMIAAALAGANAAQTAASEYTSRQAIIEEDK